LKFKFLLEIYVGAEIRTFQSFGVVRRDGFFVCYSLCTQIMYLFIFFISPFIVPPVLL